MSSQLIVKTPTELSKFLETGSKAIAAALPKHLTAERMMRLALTAFSTTPKLRECSAQSILASVVLASQLGIEIGVNGQGYLVPYKGVCTFVPGWRAQRLQDITLADICAEGLAKSIYDFKPATAGFQTWKELWESINGPGSWDANPLVKAITFEKITTK